MTHPDLADLITLAIAVCVGVLSAAAIVSWLYVERVYRERSAEAAELTRLVKRDRRIALGGSIVEVIVVWSLLSFLWPSVFQVLPRPWGAVLIGVVVALMMLGPIDDAVAFRRLREAARHDREDGDPLPDLYDPNWTEDDAK